MNFLQLFKNKMSKNWSQNCKFKMSLNKFLSKKLKNKRSPALNMKNKSHFSNNKKMMSQSLIIPFSWYIARKINRVVRRFRAKVTLKSTQKTTVEMMLTKNRKKKKLIMTNLRKNLPHLHWDPRLRDTTQIAKKIVDLKLQLIHKRRRHLLNLFKTL